MASYDYALSSFTNYRFFCSQLNTEIEAADIGMCPIYSDYVSSVCRVYTPSDLDAGQKTALDAVIAAHVPVVGSEKFVAMAGVINAEITVSSGSWSELGGTAFSMSTFFSDENRSLFRVVGDYKSASTTVELQLLEIVGTENVLNSVVWSAPSTSGAWTAFSFDTNRIPGSINCCYRLDGRMVGGGSAKLRFSSIKIIELIP